MRLLAACGSCLMVLLLTVSSQGAEEALFSEQVLPLVKKYCLECHSGNEAESGLSLDLVKHVSHVDDHPDLWEEIANRLRRGEMPPAESKQPSAEEKRQIESWIADRLQRVMESQKPNPGRVTLRRLNRLEYNNTIRDLVGIDFRPADDFPEDDTGYGFDNIGDVLSLPPMLLEKYLLAAEQIVEKAIVDPVAGKPLITIAGKSMRRVAGEIGDAGTVSYTLATNGTLEAEVEIPETDYYEIVVRAYGHQAGDEPAKMSLRIDGSPDKQFDVTAVEDKPGEYSVLRKLESGKRTIDVSFINDYYNPEIDNPSSRDRNLVVWSLQIRESGQAVWKQLPASHRRIISELPTPDNETSLARKIIREFATRAFRQPVGEAETTKLVGLFQLAKLDGATFEQAIRQTMTAILVSPRFLFRLELDSPGAGSDGVRDLTDFELASRVSYFLWSSMPDAELLASAGERRLRGTEQLKSQVERMLEDPRSSSLVESFAAQWLQLRKLDSTTPDTDRFQQFTPELRADMRKESELFFESVMRENRPITDLLDADYTFVNDRLAKHYGMEGVSGPDFQRTNVAKETRGGILTHASILTLTSNPTRTSPVKRGKWILENILGTPPPPPPPEVPELNEDATELTGTLRQRLEQHRASSACSVCHDRIDPLGFGLENYDAVGQWRTHDGEGEVDASGVLPDGRSFRGPQELKKILVAQRDDFAKAFAERMLTFAIGRGLTRSDKLAVDKIVTVAKSDNYRFKSIVWAVVNSSPFLQRSTEEAP